MLNFWLGYWNDNRETLLDGDFSAENPEALYSLVKSERGGHIIAVAHAKPILTVDGFRKLDFVNATSEEALVIRVGVDLGKRAYTVLNCMGEVMEQGEVDLSRGLHEFSVPRCGMVRL